MVTKSRNSRSRLLPAALLLAALVVAAFYPARFLGFINYDDNCYVTENEQVKRGISWSGLAWAVTSLSQANWQPLTWLSHMADVELFGMDPGGHHVTSVFWHAASAALLLLVLNGMTGSHGASFLVAALFALHPLRVESVAWLAERKDVLSAFFWMAALGLYLRYARRPSKAAYLAVAAAFGLGLAAKPMMVTLPLALILLDYWPLNRLVAGHASARRGHKAAPVNKSVIMEKVPLLIMSVLDGVVTYIAQRRGGAVESFENISLPLRLANAAVSYVKYIMKTFFPAGLSIFYPYPSQGIPLWHAAAAFVFLAIVTTMVVRGRRSRPHLAVGWFWFLGVLAPVIGLVQVGRQAFADRFSYLPGIGLFLMVVWEASGIKIPGRRGRLISVAAAAAVIMICMAGTRVQLKYWRDPVALFEHAAQVTEGNWLAYARLGSYHLDRGDAEMALRYQRQVIESKPEDLGWRYNYGNLLARLGKYEEGIEAYQEIIRLYPDHLMARMNLGLVYLKIGDFGQAARHFGEAVRIDPLFAEAHYELGVALAAQGLLPAAEEALRKALSLKPDYAEAAYNLAVVREEMGRRHEAAEK